MYLRNISYTGYALRVSETLPALHAKYLSVHYEVSLGKMYVLSIAEHPLGEVFPQI
jgi:hypothetical protein